MDNMSSHRWKSPAAGWAWSGEPLVHLAVGFVQKKPVSEVLEIKGSRYNVSEYFHSVHEGAPGGVTYDWDGDIRIGAKGGDDEIHGYVGHDYLFGDAGDDVILGFDCADFLIGEAGSDQINGGIGGDWIFGGAGQDWLTGGSGADEFFFRRADESKPRTDMRDDILDLNAEEGDVISLWLPVVNEKWTTFRLIEGGFTGQIGELVQKQIGDHVLVSGDSDGDGKADFQIEIENRIAVTGDDFTNTIYDGVGWGTDGVITGGPLRDKFFMFGSGMKIYGSSGADIFLMYNAQHLNSPTPADIIMDFDRAEGDKLDLSQLDSSYLYNARYSLGGATFSGTAYEIVQRLDGQGNTLVLFDIDGNRQADYQVLLAGAPVLTPDDFVENESRSANRFGNDITGGNVGDELYGGGGDDVLNGAQGDDTLSGDGGDDTLTGAQGTDRLFGGMGADLFVFRTTGGTAPGIGVRDLIGDFDHAEGDRIDLYNIDADAGVDGNQAFRLIVGGFTGAAGELIQYAEGAATIVAGDVNGDGVADFQIQLDGAPVLVEADFML